mmetsp:Transcript_11745/g.35796  ORF Transcript_11745/g.35796 Transcript_11745/m.35796 type:complete len:670 (-) Transcript_11745:1796-3805(-)|eukprot:CAMPEP_0198735622 /NCGR_PEP_ID=MMETSP1475-20131203/60948_1 /TAXON_ID= ORGANISM="Unidentified sp., Strain CCMP1999" /NCGR_SAMPLE_ID=MMETSP1475 /ASSEMBLY_ACC=CAM_ASM_001111 /LENGTH=669 /DNA_ID=CAMNT_0044499311 /DNA_START=333 /DNA_END=2342 /DNA_ORIENTATION=-
MSGKFLARFARHETHALFRRYTGLSSGLSVMHESGVGASLRIASRQQLSRQLHTKPSLKNRGLIDARALIVQKRCVSTGGTSEKDESRVALRDAFKSPTNIYRYSKQLVFSLVDFVKHFWTGCKLLAADVRVSAKILKKILVGKSISRRERQLLVSTGADLARLLPFSFFLLVPFMEFALPFALRLFPNMLPSQFQDSLKKEEDAKKQLKVRLEVAKYFQNVVAERAKTVRDSNAKEEIRKEAEELSKFLDSIRSGAPVEEREVFRFARFFNDELTIDGAVRPQLVAMCKYLGLTTYGSDAILRFKIRSKLNSIKNDDMQIMWEGGVDALTEEEVLRACQERGIRTIGASKRKLRRQLADWVEMSQNREVPSTLMILSRAFFYTDIPENALKETLSSLPDDVLTDIKVAADKEMSSAERLAELKRQERLIAMEEAQQERSEASERKEQAEREGEKELEKEAAAEGRAVPTGEVLDHAELGARVDQLKGALDAEVHVLQGDSPPETTNVYVKTDQTKDDEQDRLALMRIADVLETLHSDNPVEKERLELEELKAELQDLEARITDDGVKSDSQVRRLKSGIDKLEKVFEDTQQKVGLKMKLLDADKDGVIHIDEVLNAVNMIAGENSEEVIKQVLERLDENNDGYFRREDLKRLRREIKQEIGQSIKESA